MNPLVVEELTLHYDKVLSLWNLSLSIEKGSLVGIMGPNGAGKSSFIKAALGLVKPSSGKVLFWGKDIVKVRKHIAYIPQKEAIDWTFPITALEVVLMGRYHKMGFWKRARKADRIEAERALDQLGLYHLKDRQIADLSGGQQKRVFIARALAQEAEMYFLDEPFQGVDVETEKTVIKLLKELTSKGVTICVVHHDVTTAAAYFDQLILLHTSLLAMGPPKEVLSSENITALYRNHHDLFEEVKQRFSQKLQGAP